MSMLDAMMADAKAIATRQHMTMGGTPPSTDPKCGRKTGMTPPIWEILEIITANPGLTAMALSKIQGTPRKSVRDKIKVLRANGYTVDMTRDRAPRYTLGETE